MFTSLVAKVMVVAGAVVGGAIGMLLLASLALAGVVPSTTSASGAATVDRPAGAAIPAPSGAAATVVAFARAQLGAPYRWAGAGPGSWDCSGLVMVAYRQVAMTLPHNALAQYEATAAATVSLGALRPGDLVFFGPDLARISHVGIYVGAGDMIDAPHTGAVVRVESIHWTDLLAGTRPLALSAAAR